MADKKQNKVLSPIQKIFGEDFNLPLFLTIFKRSLIWIFLFIAMALGAVQLYDRYTPDNFQAASKLMYKEKEASKALEFVEKNNINEALQDVEIIKSADVLKRVVARLPLQVSYFNEGKVLNKELYPSAAYQVDVNVLDSNVCDLPIYVQFHPDKTASISYNLHGKQAMDGLKPGELYASPHFEFIITVPPEREQEIYRNQEDVKYFFVINHPKTLVNKFSSKISVAFTSSRTQTISINVTDHEPAKAADIANAVAEVYIDYDLERQKESATGALRFIQQQIDSIDKDLLSYEELLKRFKVENKMVNPENERGFLMGRFETLEEQQTELSRQAASLQWLKKYLEDGKTVSAISQEMIDDKFVGLATYINQIAQLEEEKKELNVSVTEHHLRMQYIDEQLKGAREDLYANIEAAENRLELEGKYLALKASNFENEFSSLPDKEAEYARLRRGNELKEKYFLMLKDRETEFEITKAGIVPNYIILKKAEGAALISPKLRLIQMAGIGLGLFLGLFLVVVRYLLQNKFQTISEVEDLSEVPVLGLIPRHKNKNDVAEIVVGNNPKSIISESFRSIRSNLEFLSANDGRAKTVVITSTVSGEGKTFVALNLASVLNMINKKVIIVDFDMRKPKVHKAFNQENTKGTSTILINKTTVDECIYPSGIENLDFIPSGPIPPNPAELIISGNRNIMLDYLKTKYDILVIDTPPIGLVADSLELIKAADYPLYILRAEYSKREFINFPNKLYKEQKAGNLGVILNDAKLSYGGYGKYNYSYGYGYGYSKKYGGGYYADEEKDTPAWSKFWRRFSS